MDRNLWATAVYSWTEGSTVLWNYYQWWNNKARLNAGSISWINSPVSTSGYWWWTFYTDSSSSMRRDWRTRNDWSSNQNDNLWWWEWDTTTSNWAWTNTTRKWPCPTGRHVPSTVEWLWLVNTWCSYRLWGSCSWNATNVTSFKNDLKLPFAGNRNRDSTSAINQGSNGYYWSSSPTGARARFLTFYASSVSLQESDLRALGVSVRCFKN
jgi:hypothetical protein